MLVLRLLLAIVGPKSNCAVLMELLPAGYTKTYTLPVVWDSDPILYANYAQLCTSKGVGDCAVGTGDPIKL